MSLLYPCCAYHVNSPNIIALEDGDDKTQWKGVLLPTGVFLCKITKDKIMVSRYNDIVFAEVSVGKGKRKEWAKIEVRADKKGPILGTVTYFGGVSGAFRPAQRPGGRDGTTRRVGGRAPEGRRILVFRLDLGGGK